MASPIVSIRADANPRVGYGHIMRTLAVAKNLVEAHATKVRFFIAADSDKTIVEEQGYAAHVLKGSGVGLEEMVDQIAPVDGPILLDSYQIEESDLLSLRRLGYKVAMFDDGQRLADYPCDLVIDSAPDAIRLAYKSTTKARFCLGSDYYPLRQEFLTRGVRQSLSDTVKNLLVTFGGSDPYDQTVRVLRILKQMDFDFNITAVLGNGYEGSVEEPMQGIARIQVHRNVKNMASLMQDADMAISSAGGTACELAYSGVPAVLISLTDDQVPLAAAMDRLGSAKYIGHWDQCADANIEAALFEFIADKGLRTSKSMAGKSLIDGNGIRRVADAVSDIQFD